MKLEYVNKVNKVTDEEIISDMKRVSVLIEKNSITISDYETYGKYDPTTVMRHFGSWNKALESIGLKIINKQYSLKELYDNLAEIWISLGRQPSRRDLMRLNSPISYKAYERKFGKWSIALESFVEYFNTSGGIVTDMSFSDNGDQHKTSRDINLRMRFMVMQRDNFKCCICGASPAKDASVELHIDHIIPWSKGGETVIENLQTLCSKCNLGKSDLMPK